MEKTEQTNLLSSKKQKNDKHDVTSAVLIFVTLATYIIMINFNYLNGSGASDLFASTVGELSGKYVNPIGPAGFTFSIWPLIYTWLAATLGVLVVTIFLTNDMGRIYQNPEFASPLLMLVMTVNFILNFTWLFVWDREFLVLGALVISLQTATGIAVIALMARNIYNNKEELSEGQPKFLGLGVWHLAYWLMMNGFGVYTTWVTIAFILNLDISLIYAVGFGETGSSLACLSLVVVLLSVYFVLENTVLDKYIRFLLTPYAVLIWGSYGIRSTYADPDSTKADTPMQIQRFVDAILVLSSIALILRFIIVVLKTGQDRDTKRDGITPLKGINHP